MIIIIYFQIQWELSTVWKMRPEWTVVAAKLRNFKFLVWHWRKCIFFFVRMWHICHQWFPFPFKMRAFVQFSNFILNWKGELYSLVSPAFHFLIHFLSLVIVFFIFHYTRNARVWGGIVTYRILSICVEHVAYWHNM